MTDMVERDLDLDDEPVPLTRSPDESVLDVIRRRREEHVAEQFYDMLPPGYNGCLVLRCGPLTPEAQTTTRLRLQALERKKDPTRDFAINADTIIMVCDEVLARKTRKGPLEPLIEGEQVGIDIRLTEALRIDRDLGIPSSQITARMLVRELFRAAPSPEIAVGVHVNEYLEWAQGVESEADEGLMGES